MGSLIFRKAIGSRRYRSLLFPQEYDATYCKGEEKDHIKPQTAMNKLNEFLTYKTPLQFVITETAVNVPVYIASHQSTFRGGEIGDVYFDITLRTWSEMKVAKTAGAVGHLERTKAPGRHEGKEQDVHREVRGLTLQNRQAGARGQLEMEPDLQAESENNR